MSRVIVLKFGGSYLRGPADLVRAVHAIYAHVRKGERVVCVTSAFYGRTDALEESLRALDATTAAPSSRHVRAALLSTGEVETANLLIAALDRSGVPAAYADVRRYGPFVEPGTEEPKYTDAEGLRALLEAHPVVVVPGFAAVENTPERAHALLGRGGSDMTAVVLGRDLGARTILVKDVEGLYTADPAKHTDEAPPRRLARVSFSDALKLGPDILQPRAVRLAQSCGLPFEVVGPGHVAGMRSTSVGFEATHERSRPSTPRPLRIGLLGLGAVGERVFAELSSAPDRFDVTAILVRDLESRERPKAALRLLTVDVEDVFASAPDLIIEATGGHQPAARWTARALHAGIHVVTANKVAAALECEPTADEVARRSGTQYRCSAAVGGSLPALEAVARAARENDPLVRLEGILNGTSNAVLSDVQRGLPLDQAIAAAQEAGLAEADPTDDLDGTDVAHKLELLARAAGWTPPRWLRKDGVNTRPDDLRNGADKNEEGRVRLVGTVFLSDVGPVARVAPRICGPSDPLYSVDGEWNALVLTFESGREITLRGRGAGPWPTATAILGDVYAIARRLHVGGAHGEFTETASGKPATHTEER